jgi:hypothetical protein
MEQKHSPTWISLGMQILSDLKLRATIGIFFVLGWIVRKIYPDPLAEFFVEMERSGRLKIEGDRNDEI